MENIIDWLLNGDVAIQFQTKRDLMNCDPKEINVLQARISKEGWGKDLLERRNNTTGLWGNGIYTPKWISTHYTLLELKNLGLLPTESAYIESSQILLDKMWKDKGKVTKDRYQDLCVCAMIINIAAYANIKSKKLFEIVDYLIDHQYEDGGWNCNWQRGDMHSSLHTTLSVLEGIDEYEKNDYKYRIKELVSSRIRAHSFILKHNIFQSHRTGEPVSKHMLMLSYPGRWKYDILRCLDYFQAVNETYDNRMDDAIAILLKKKRKNNKWPLQQKHPGLTHFDMEQTGTDSRWNTLRALRVLKKYRFNYYSLIVV